ncbi:MAG: 30S ribosomal protein S4 [Candidatus Margulisiibacteriota bacterium]|jgi:small subunit ribosomal protein S4
MGRAISDSCKKCRRSKDKLFLKGTRCLTAKCSLEKRNFVPGGSRIAPIKKMSEYGVRLREKQKVKFFYGISEGQIRNYFKMALRSKDITGHVLLNLCERRLDNVIKRANTAKSRAEARLLIIHGHCLVNNKKVDIPSYLIKIGDKISFVPKIVGIVEKNQEILKDVLLPAWLNYDAKEHTITVLRIPVREDIDIRVSEQLVVEFYSR